MGTKISVVIPTHNRLRLLRACLASLEKQTAPPDSFEVVVSVDGSPDGTIDFLKAYRPPFNLRYFDQANRGAASARNTGIRNAASNLILCLDDDIIASPQLIEEHLRSHEACPDSLVQGALLVHDSVSQTPFLRYEKNRYETFKRAMEKPPGKIAGDDVSSGNISLRKSLLTELGGFNETLDLKALNNDDGELALRLERRHVPLVYNGRALGFMAHVKSLEEQWSQSYLYGKTHVYLQKEFPEASWKLSPWVQDKRSLPRNALRLHLLFYSRQKWNFPWLERLLKTAVKLSEIFRLTPVSAALYRLSLDYYFWKGVHAASGGRLGRYFPRGVPILCYHNISDTYRKEISLYILPTKRFARQMRWIKRLGYQPISLDTLHAYLDRGQPIPSKPVVVTFDDGYRELKSTATPLLARMGFCHTHFLNSDKLGGTTDWIGKAPDLPILSRDEVKEMDRVFGKWVDFQAHGKSHLSLKNRDPETIRDEIGGSAAAIESLLQRPARHLAYPFGEYDDATVQVASSMPLRCAFTVDQGLCKPGQDLYRLPRVEIFRNDWFLDFVFKLFFGWSPIASLRTLLKKRYKKILRKVRRVDSPISYSRLEKGETYERDKAV